MANGRTARRYGIDTTLDASVCGLGLIMGEREGLVPATGELVGAEEEGGWIVIEILALTL